MRSARSPASGIPIPVRRRATGPAPPPGSPLPSLPPTAGVYGREWRVASSNLTRALGRPIRDQVIPVRSGQASTLQALELVNGEILTRWLSRGARRMLGETPAETLSLYNRTVAGRGAKPAPFVVDVSGATRLWLIVQENGSNMPRALLPAWAQAELVGPVGCRPALEPHAGRPLGASSRNGTDRGERRDRRGRSRPESVRGCVRHRGQRVHELPWRHRPREPAGRNRLHPRPADQVLRLWCATGHGPIDSATPGGSIAARRPR